MAGLSKNTSILASIIAILPQPLISLYYKSEPSSRDDYEDFLIELFSIKPKDAREKTSTAGTVVTTAVPASRMSEDDLPDITVHEFMEQVAQKGFPNEEEIRKWGQFGRTMLILKPLYVS